MQYFKHWAAGLDHAVRLQSLSEQILPGNRTIGHINVADVVHYAPVNLFGRSIVEAPIPCFHMKHRNSKALSGKRCKAAVCIAEDQHRIWADLRQGFV